MGFQVGRVHQEATDDDQSMISSRDSKETWLSEMDEKSSADSENSGDNKLSSQEGEVYRLRVANPVPP
jgi:hypothetical protein